MKLRLRILAAAMILASTDATVAAQLSLKTESMVRGPRVMLGEVVTLDNADRAEKQMLAAIDLGAAPLPGYTSRLTRKEIERKVRSRNLNAAITWHGAEAVKVERVAEAFDTRKVVDSAEAYLRQQLLGGVDRVELQQSEQLADMQLPAGAVTFKARPLSFAQAAHRHVTVWMDVIVDDVFFRSVTVPFDVHAYRNVLVAKRDLPAGATPQCEALATREADITVLDSVPLPADCGAVQGRLKRNLQQGSALLKTHMQMPMAVAQGDSVSLQMVDGALLLESRATALVDGEVGQRISVKPSAGVDTIIAEVIAPGMVRVNGR